MTHKFSNEIYTMIVDNLQAEVSTLRKLSLVNKAFAAGSRSIIWRRVILRTSPVPTPNHDSSCAGFYGILNGGVLTPPVADLVQEFCIDDTDFPSMLSTDVYLPLVLDGLTGIIRLNLFNMSWPTHNGHPLITSIRNLLRSTSLECVTIVSDSSVIPTFLVDDCLAVRTLRLKGSYIADITPSDSTVEDVETHSPQPQHMILNVDPEVAEDVWLRVDTFYLQSLVIPLPVYEENAQIDGHALQCLGLNYMEDAADSYPVFKSLANLRQLFIAFPTWITSWPNGLADLLEWLDPLMQNLEQIHLYLLVEAADSLVKKNGQGSHLQGFQILDRKLACLRSPRLVDIHVALCPNSDPVTHVRGTERVMAELPLTYARNILSVDVVAELPWESMFRI